MVSVFLTVLSSATFIKYVTTMGWSNACEGRFTKFHEYYGANPFDILSKVEADQVLYTKINVKRKYKRILTWYLAKRWHFMRHNMDIACINLITVGFCYIHTMSWYMMLIWSR